MMKSIKKIIIISLLIISIINISYARYIYNIELDAFSLTRDSTEITYAIKKSSNEYTNKDVTLEIETNKPVEEIEWFEISDDGKKLIHTFSENTNGSVVLKDFSGNKREISYEINNIDKTPPIIDGIENGKNYTTSLKPNYNDNIGIKRIEIEKYGTALTFNCYTNYYDTNSYKGIDVNKDSIYVWITDKPKGTVKYRYYMNNILKAETDDKEYTFTKLKKGTEYTVKIEAINNSDDILGTVTKKIKTRYFDKLIANKEGKTFNVTVQGLEPEITDVVITKFSASNRDNITYVGGNINSDRSVSAKLVATDITQTLENGYYYLQFHLKKEFDQTIDVVSCYIIFNTNFIKENYKIDPYNITQNGYYEIKAYDLAGNKTERMFTITK